MATSTSPSLILPTITLTSASAITPTTSELPTSSSALPTTTSSISSPSTTSPTTTSQSTPSSSSISSTSSTPTSSSPSVSSSASLTTSSSISSSSSTPVTSSTPSLTSSSSASSTSSLSTQLQLSTSGNVVFTRTSVVVITPTSSTTANEDRASTGFFHNKGAVAGVFTVVGLIALIIFFILGTTFIRKRRARKFDKEIDEAAAEAAAASRGPDFDDYDYNPAHAASGGYTGYSDGSHGTFAQPPMSIGHASDYRMADVPNFDPAFGVGASGAAGAGAAGIGAGVGTAAMQRARSRRDGQPQVPYNAFGAAPQEQYEMQDSRLRYRGNTTGPDYDLLDAAALTGTAGDPYAVARGPSTRTGTTQYSNSGSGAGSASGGALSRNQSQNAREMLSPSVEEDYPLTTAFAGTSDGHGAPAYYSPQVPPDSYATYGGAGGAVQHMPEPQHEVDPYGGYIDASPSPGMPIPNPHSPFTEMAPAHQQTASPDDTDDEDEHMPPPHDAHAPGQHVLGDSRASLGDQEDYGYESERRVLRVANE